MNLQKMAIAMLIVFSPVLVQANALPSAGHIEINGVGQLDVVPNIATLTISVKMSSATAVEAKKEVDKRVADYFIFLTKMSVEKKDMNAANIMTHPEYEYPPNSERVLKGYSAVRNVTVTVRSLEKLNGLMDGALAAQLNEISQIQLGVSDPKQYRDQVRKIAVENAKAQAKALAEELGEKLGKPYRISYSMPHDGGGRPYPVMRAKLEMSGASMADTSATYEQETIKFSDQVNIVFYLQ